MKTEMNAWRVTGRTPGKGYNNLPLVVFAKTLQEAIEVFLAANPGAELYSISHLGSALESK